MNQRSDITVAVLFIFLHLDIQPVLATHMRGGSISWRQLNSSTVEINYWFAWRHDFREYGHDHCTPESYENQAELRLGEHLKYKGPGDLSYTSIYEIKYKCTDNNPDFGWVAGVGAFNFTSPSQVFTISVETCCWIRLMNYPVPRNIRLTTGVDLTEFSNIEEINNSPIASTVPLQRVQRQCNALIKIAASDPDGDDVRCRWANNNEIKDDCDEVCGALPATAELFRRDCVIAFESVDLAPGYYAVTVMVEDFVSTSSRSALSKVPIQFLLEVFVSDRSCQRPFFISPTPADGRCIPTPAHEPMEFRIAARNSDTARPIADIATVGLPLGMSKTAIGTVDGIQSDYFVDFNWTPSPQQTGSHQMCFIAQDRGVTGDTQKYTSKQTCATINVGGSPLHIVPDQSFPRPGQIVPPSNFQWTLIFDDDIVLPQVPAFVTFLNLTGDPVYTVSVQNSEAQTHVRVLPNHVGLRIETPDFFLDGNTEYTIRIHQGVVESIRRGCGRVASDYAEWSFKTEDRLVPGNIQSPDEHRDAGRRPIPECRSSFMVVYIAKALVGTIDPSTMHLDDATCTGAYHNETHYSIGTTYAMCNTQVHETSSVDGNLRHFENTVHIPSQPYTNGSVITRTHRIEIHVSCTMANQRPIFAEFDPNITTIVFHETGYGEFQFSLLMCSDDTFAEKYKVMTSALSCWSMDSKWSQINLKGWQINNMQYKRKTGDFPIEVDLRQRLFFEARLYATGPTGLWLQSCKATPTANPGDLIYYEFLRDGCPVDDTVQIHDSPARKSRFSIESFAFLGHFIGDTVFVHCEMRVCNVSDPKCTQPCEEASIGLLQNGLSLAKRDVSHTSLPTSLTYTNTDGPIRIRDRLAESSYDERDPSSASRKSSFSVASLIQIPMMVIIVCVLVLLLIVLLRVHSILRHRGHRANGFIKKIRDPVTLDIAALSKS